MGAVTVRLLALFMLPLSLGCGDGMFAMSLTDGPEEMRLWGAEGTRILLDWTVIGGHKARTDRLLLTEDGYARRNKGGNRVAMRGCGVYQDPPSCRGRAHAVAT